MPLGRERSGWGRKGLRKEALKRFPEDREVQLSVSQFFEETERMDRAEACLRQILARNPNDRPVSRQLAIILSARAVNAKAWEAAWAALGPEAPEIDQPEDRLARAMILSRARTRPAGTTRSNAWNLLSPISRPTSP